MKRLISLILTLLLLPCLTLTALATSSPPVSDNESLLTDMEETELMLRIQELKDTYSIDIMIVTTESFNGKNAQEYADGWYDFAGGGDDGVLFLLSLNQREWYISTAGIMIYALTDYGIQQIGEETAGYLSQGSYYEGLACFLDSLPDYLDAYLAGAPIEGNADYSGSYYHGEREETVHYREPRSPNLVLSLVCGVIAAIGAVLIMRACMNTKLPQRSAAVYLKPGSYHLTSQRDIFLYSNVSKVRRQQHNGGDNGGGSSVHRSSGGRRHGGGGGRF